MSYDRVSQSGEGPEMRQRMSMPPHPPSHNSSPSPSNLPPGANYFSDDYPDSDPENALPEPVMPWLRSEAGSRPTSPGMGPGYLHSPWRDSMASISGSSLHVVKRFPEAPGLKKRMRWTKHKWLLLFANTLLFIYGLGCVILALLTYFQLYLRAPVVIVSEETLLILATVAGSICLFTSLLGYAGIMLNNRSILTLYNLMLWPCFAMIASVGYVAYKRQRWNLPGKLSFQWHFQFSAADRYIVQTNLHCCGYKTFSDFPERSNKCYPRTLLPGCQFKYQQFQRMLLTDAYIVAFSVVPAHMFVIIVALMCGNHVNRQFGKNLPPKIYRVDPSVAVIGGDLVAGTPTGSTFNLHPIAIDPASPRLSVKGQSVVITGGGSGIGAEIAKAFARAGASHIALLGRRETVLIKTKQAIEGKHPNTKVHTVAADVVDKEAVVNAFSHFKTIAGTVDILINNAGYLSTLGPFAEVDFDDWWLGYEINVKGAFYVTKAFLAVASNDAVIVNISAAMAHAEYFPGFSSYHTSKLAAAKFFDYVQREHSHIFVVNVHPGVYVTDMARKGLGAKMDTSRFGNDIVLAAWFTVWVVSSEARFLKGKFVWANWDVDELKARRKEIEGTSRFTLGLLGWP
ncbi:hypothetical protein BZG36_00460 [Bifiguratus adelaidae]|uniref:Ketoreductase domain-containing protein n=1 Tax=Bifiguratus adelaidae TaxID=1938954 RepID=A0A261Y745_9FUNG|nr:hypothetical protein BZG36_00460 [Bifiguratus adelaidae]